MEEDRREEEKNGFVSQCLLKERAFWERIVDLNA